MTGERTCSGCGASWPGRRARFCGTCGEPLRPGVRRPDRRLRPHRVALAAVALTALAAVATGIAPRLGSTFLAGSRGDLGVDLPPQPTGTTRPRVAVATAPEAPVRCRTSHACLRWRLPPVDSESGSPVLADGHLVVPTDTGLLGYRTATGEPVWRSDLGGADVPGPTVVPVVDAPGHLVVAVRDERLAAVTAVDGAVVWRQAVAGLDGVRAAQAVGDGWLVAARVRGDDELTSFVAVFAVDASDGTIRWRRQAANAALSPAGAVLQDVNGTLTGLAADGSEAWTLVTDRPAASLTPLGALLLVGARDDALVVEVASGDVLDEIVGPPSQVRADADAVVWPIAGGVGYRAADGTGWRADVPGIAGCCSGFVRDAAGVTVLTGRGEMVRFAAADGAIVDRHPAPGQFAAADGRAWLYGGIALSPVPGSGGLARLHDTFGGDHLADITSEAYALLATGDDTWVVLAPGYALTLDPAATRNGEGRPVGSARLR